MNSQKTLGWLLEVDNLSNAIAETLDEIRETLEVCLNTELSGITCDCYPKEVLDYYSALAQERNVSFPEIVADAKAAFLRFDTLSSQLLEELKAAKKIEDRILKSSELAQVIAEFIWDYWSLILPSSREKLINELESRLKVKKTKFRWLNTLKERARLLLPSFRSGKNLFEIQTNSTRLFFSALFEAIAEDRSKIAGKDKVPDKLLKKLDEEISHISDLAVRESLEAERKQVSTFSDARSLLETVHIFRSKKNSERFLAALKEADTEVTKPISIAEMQRELGFVKEG